MSSNLTPPVTTAGGENLFAAVDIGTNSFKLIIGRADPSSGRFLTVNRLKEPVLLGLDADGISDASLRRATDALLKFQRIIRSHGVFPAQSRLVATSAVREASNQSQFLCNVSETLGFDIDILSGTEEARLIYLGVLQFHPVFDNTVLTVDIGGGSTEFAVGFQGNVLFSTSLKLGHVTLTREFHDIMKMREYIENKLKDSSLIEKIKEFKIDNVIGSSGTIKAIENAISKGYTRSVGEEFGVFEEFYKREWRFTREELKDLAKRMCAEGKEKEGKIRRAEFFKRRSEFILAGTILLEVIFEMLGIEEMEVSGYALGEGVIAEMYRTVSEGFDMNANARWRSVLRLMSRFNNKKRMRAAEKCAAIAREIFKGLKGIDEIWSDDCDGVLASLDGKDLECLEAACLLHNIGLYAGKKGYHKQSYCIIVNGDHLQGYNAEEVKLIAKLVKHHRKKHPNCDMQNEAGQKFRALCSIIRVSAVLQQFIPENMQEVELQRNYEGLQLVLREAGYQSSSPGILLPLMVDANAAIEKELEHFTIVFGKKLSIVVHSGAS